MWEKLDPRFHYKAVYYELDSLDNIIDKQAFIANSSTFKEQKRRRNKDTFISCSSASSFTVPEFAAAKNFSSMYWLGTGDFLLARREAIEAARGYIHAAQGTLTDDILPCRLVALGYSQLVLGGECGTVHQNHLPLSRVRSDAGKWLITDSQTFCDDPHRLFFRFPWEPRDWGWGDCELQQIVW